MPASNVNRKLGAGSPTLLGEYVLMKLMILKSHMLVGGHISDTKGPLPPLHVIELAVSTRDEAISKADLFLRCYREKFTRIWLRMPGQMIIYE